MIHENSRIARRAHNAGLREQQILRALASRACPMTDRAISYWLGSADLNFARPGITKLVQAGTLAEVDNVKCPESGRRVRRVWFSDTRSMPNGDGQVQAA